MSLSYPPWTLAAVCVMVPGLTLLVFNLADPVVHLLPWYAAVYLLIGACIFGPTRKAPSLRQAVAFLLPGTLLVPLALTNVGFWAGGWLLGLPAWGLLLTRWTRESPLSAVQVLKFLGLLLLGMTIYTLNIMYPFPSLGLFLLPLIPLIRLATAEYRARPLQVGVEILLATAAVAVAFAIPAPEGSWSSPWVYAGGAATAGLMIAYWAWRLPRGPRHMQLNNGAVV
jgi:hypothetical protein